MIVKVQPYHKNQVEVNNQKQRALKLKQLNKRLHALQLSKEELEGLLLKHSFSAP